MVFACEHYDHVREKKRGPYIHVREKYREPYIHVREKYREPYDHPRSFFFANPMYMFAEKNANTINTFAWRKV